MADDTWDVSMLVSPPLGCRRKLFRTRSRSMSFPLLPPPAELTHSSNLRAMSVDAMAEKLCHSDPPEKLHGQARLGRNVFAALVACFMGATDGLSLGSLLFPSSAEFPRAALKREAPTSWKKRSHEYQEPQVNPKGIPTVIVLAEHFKTLGPGRCATIYFMVAVCSFLIGAGMWLVGRLRLARLVKACPFVIYGGFMAGTGAVLLQYALNLMVPGFVSLVEVDSYTALFLAETLWQWLPGALGGAAMFALWASRVRVGASIPQDLLIPVFLISEASFFLAWMLWTGRGLEAARDEGLLFPVRMPSEGPNFYEVWTMHFEHASQLDLSVFICPNFWLTVVNAACISVLTAVMNIFGTLTATQIRVDIDREMMLHGSYNMGCGALSGLPANMVMSFSVTCRALGADGRQFQMLLLGFSAAAFVAGGYVVAVLPKLLPGSVLIWLSFELMAFWVWNSRRFLRVYEYCLVWIMVFFYVAVGTAPMMLFGFMAVLGIVSGQLASIPVIRSQKTLGHIRSSVLHTTCDTEYLNRRGAEAEVWTLGTGYLYFASMRQIVEELENFNSQHHLRFTSPSDSEELPDFAFSHAISCEARPHPLYIIMNFDMVQQMECTAVSAFQEVLSVAKELGCTLILAHVQSSLILQMQNFGLPLAELQDQAVEWVEEAFLRSYQPAPGQCRGHTHGNLRDLLSRHVDMQSPLAGLHVDFHVWLDGYFPSYNPELLSELVPLLEIRKLQKGDVVYSAPKTRQATCRSSGMVYSAPKFQRQPRGGAWMSEGQSPPLLWLLLGSVEHIWNPENETEQSVRVFQDQNRLEAGSVFEKASIHQRQGSWCAGPFSTARAFLANMAHPGTLRAVDCSTVALLPQEAYDQLSPALRRLLNAYLLRKWPTYLHS
ncbi:putative vacuolar membrane protein [Symbiodinium microadriaticum]|uniref:Putative vacuolar membrane protein n=1 Tax=Symbiodinium microadriaticum TaxID=2951 RepID=A0A1Q9CRV1_SYMMI|nr:putative vacuolar membrane protein [Symbiodinium microadriaticum]